ncbi:MAG TPA: cyanophycinase [Pyrinomonadaceae bacterium]|nr:cyanophycinase [Pyrinomonadaceae bacterium]
MSKRKKAESRAGRLVIIGGAEDRDGQSEILREFVRLAGGARARVVVISVASDAPAEVASVYVKTFKRLGVRDVRALDIAGRADASGESAAAAVREATGVFFTGGNQLRITRLLGGTLLDTTLHRCHEDGLVLAGTSAGAAMMSSVMIVGSAPTLTLRAGMVELGSGLGFLPGVLIDQHFEQRGRLRRLLAAIAQHPHELGVGIDENTAAVVEGHTLEVTGSGSVTIIDAGGLTHTNLGEAQRHELLAICGVRVHVLPAGYRFDLQNREPLLGSSPLNPGPSSVRRGADGKISADYKHRRVKVPR